jgi:hypothetical protein
MQLRMETPRPRGVTTINKDTADIGVVVAKDDSLEIFGRQI